MHVCLLNPDHSLRPGCANITAGPLQLQIRASAVDRIAPFERVQVSEILHHDSLAMLQILLLPS